jgi:hypothetical protein
MDITDDCTAGVAADGTYIGKGLVWSLSDTSNYGVLFCATGDGTAPSLDWTVMRIHPDLQWGGGDITWQGGQEFDASADISGNVAMDGDLTIDGNVAIDGNMDATGLWNVMWDMTVYDSDGNDLTGKHCYSSGGSCGFVIAFGTPSAANAVLAIYAGDLTQDVGDHSADVRVGYAGSTDTGNNHLTLMAPIKKSNCWEINMANFTLQKVLWMGMGCSTCVDKD